jgi:hypothetical protein
MASANQEGGYEILNEGSPSSKKKAAEHGIDVTITESILGLQKLFQQRERELEERSKELERVKVELEKEYPTFGAKPSDILRLNCGGTKIDVFRRTLTCVEGSLLASQFSGRWDDSLAKDADGDFFIDQPVDLFLILLNYLRNRESDTPLAPPLLSPSFGQDMYKKSAFLRMLEQYNLTLGVYPFSVYRIESTGNVEVLKGLYPGTVVSNTSGTPESYVLSRTEEAGHSFLVKGFEVAFQKGTKAFVGVSSRTTVREVMNSHGGGSGVGYSVESIGIDIARHGIAYKNASNAPVGQTFTRMEGVDLNDTAVIRCEDSGLKWYVNDKLVAMVSPPAGEGVVDISGFHHPSRSDWPPVVTIHSGSFHFTSIKLQF